MFIHQAFEAEEPTVEEELEADKGISQPEPEPEQNSEYQQPETSVTQDQDSVPLLPLSDPVPEFAAELEDHSNALNLQDNIPDRQDISTSSLIVFSQERFSSFNLSVNG